MSVPRETSPPALLQDVPRETVERLELFVALMMRWNEKINLVSPRDLAQLWPRHIEDSLQLVRLLPPACDRATDLGSGGGFPGLILSIATGIAVTLVESDLRKASFLREAARETAAPATVVARRIEACGVAPAPLVTARALAPLDKLLSWSEPLLQPNGMCLFLKGRGVEDELTQAGRQWHMAVTRTPSRSHPDGVILSLSRIRRAPTHEA